MPHRITLLVSVDTEEDNWDRAREGVTVDNIRQIPRLHAFLRGLGVRPTYLVTYQVARVKWAAEILREASRSGAAEVGAHLHPWNTPPFDEPLQPRNSMLKNLPRELQLAKLRTLTTLLRDTIGPPRTFRAGRYGLGSDTVLALLDCGYQIDSSVTPFVTWETTDDGPDFRGAPHACYRLDAPGDIRVPRAEGPMWEVPISCGHAWGSPAWWNRVHALVASPLSRRLYLDKLVSWSGLLRPITLSPEINPLPDLLALSRALVQAGAQFLHLTWHSPSLVPGLSPFMRSPAAVDQLYRRIAEYVTWLHESFAVDFATISEFADVPTPHASGAGSSVV